MTTLTSPETRTARKAPTISDVARVAGVSKATAAEAYRGGGRVSAKTRELVMQTARDLNYRPNALAQSLSRQRSDIISFYSGQGYLDLRDQFISALVAGLHEGCEAHRRDLLLHSTFRGTYSHEIYDQLASGKADGLVFHTPTDNPLIDMMVESQLPVVAVAVREPQLPSVMADLVQGTRVLVEYLWSLGHRRILFRACPYDEHPMSSVIIRHGSFHQAARELGLTVYTVCAADHSRELDPLERELLALSARQRPTAAVCWGDNAAHSLWQNCQDAGIKVPEDLAIAGLDGLRSGPGNWPQVTSLQIPWVEIASTAVTLLVQRIENKEVPLETVFPVGLSVGNTT